MTKAHLKLSVRCAKKRKQSGELCELKRKGTRPGAPTITGFFLLKKKIK